MRGAIWVLVVVAVLGGTAIAQTSGQTASEPSVNQPPVNQPSVNQPSVKKTGEASQSNPSDANADELKALEADNARERTSLASLPASA